MCLEGVGWRSASGVGLYPGNGVTLAVLTRDAPGRHSLRLERPPAALTIHQAPLDKVSDTSFFNELG